jgi:quercetin dioxygenase-like cupin family protein
MIPAAEVLSLQSLVTLVESGVASRVLGKAPGGTVTLFAFDVGQGLTEHTSPYDAMVHVLDGEFVVTIGDLVRTVPAGSIIRLPANIPHALEAPVCSRMLLIMIK